MFQSILLTAATGVRADLGESFFLSATLEAPAPGDAIFRAVASAGYIDLAVSNRRTSCKFHNAMPLVHLLDAKGIAQGGGEFDGNPP